MSRKKESDLRLKNEFVYKKFISLKYESVFVVEIDVLPGRFDA